MRLGMLPSVTLLIGGFMPLLAKKKQAAWLYLMAGDLPSSSLITSQSFQWGSGLEIGLAKIGS